jgi:hypothetical protein
LAISRQHASPPKREMPRLRLRWGHRKDDYCADEADDLVERHHGVTTKCAPIDSAGRVCFAEGRGVRRSLGKLQPPEHVSSNGLFYSGQEC